MKQGNSSKSEAVAGAVTEFLDETHQQTLLKEVAERLKLVSEGEDRVIEVTTAYKLTSDQIKRLRAIFKSIIEGNYEVTNIVNPAVIGGMKVKYRDLLLDMSLAKRIERLRQKLKKGI